MTRVRGATALVGGAAATGYWGGMTLGRLVLPFVTVRLGEYWSMLMYLGLTIGFELVFWLVPNLVVSAVAAALIGVCMGMCLLLSCFSCLSRILADSHQPRCFQRPLSSSPSFFHATFTSAQSGLPPRLAALAAPSCPLPSVPLRKPRVCRPSSTGKGG